MPNLFSEANPYFIVKPEKDIARKVNYRLISIINIAKLISI